MKKCKSCKNVIEDGSLYCRFCGEKLFVQKRELSVPKPRILADGSYSAQIMVDGKRIVVHGRDEAEYRANARAYKVKAVEAKYNARYKLGDVVDMYISANEAVLSPSTLRGYGIIRRNRFKAFMDMYLDDINWQQMISIEAKKKSAKTIKNSWSLVSASLSFVKYEVPDVNLPAIPRREKEFLDYEQVTLFLKAVKGTNAELPALLALHSLRMSELRGIEVSDIKDGYINIHGAVVRDADNVFVRKETNKTEKSTRRVPVLLDRIYEILPENGRLVPEMPHTVTDRINDVCRRAGLPEVGCHGLRHSFASLCYHLDINERTVCRLGGWSNMQTVHKIYIHLSNADVDADVKKLRDYFEITTDT